MKITLKGIPQILLVLEPKSKEMVAITLYKDEWKSGVLERNQVIEFTISVEELRLASEPLLKSCKKMKQ
jgi:hypothetical protein